VPQDPVKRRGYFGQVTCSGEQWDEDEFGDLLGDEFGDLLRGKHGAWVPAYAKEKED